VRATAPPRQARLVGAHWLRWLVKAGINDMVKGRKWYKQG
jgi:hypothetical protein